MSAFSRNVDGEKIKKLRLTGRMSQTDLATKAMCDAKTIRNAEAGNRIAVSMITQIATALGITASEIEKPDTEPARTTATEKVGAIVRTTNKALAREVCYIFKITLSLDREPEVEVLRSNSVLVVMQMTQDDAIKAIRLFPDFREHARAALAETPEGKEYYANYSDPRVRLQHKRIEFLRYVIDSITELRFFASPDAEGDTSDSEANDGPDLSGLRNAVSELSKGESAVMRYQRNTPDEAPEPPPEKQD